MTHPDQHPRSDGHSYAIRVAGHLAPRWAEAFGGMTITPFEDGTTVLDGLVTDQAALHGLLRTVRDLGLPLVSVTRLDDPTSPSAPPTDTTPGA